MEINKILSEYDSMFGKCSLKEIEEYLRQKIDEAKALAEYGIEVSLLNEMIGFCRDTMQKDKALSYCDELKEMLKHLHLEGSVEYATSMLNIANAYRAFGLFEESLNLHESVYESYRKHIEPNDFMYASLFNNWSLLYQELGEYNKAEEMLKKALSVVDLYEDAVIQQAITRTNLAMTLLQMNTEEAYEEALMYLGEALEVFERDGEKDFHYGAALVAMGDAYCFKKEYEKAAEYYKRGMSEQERHVGKTDNYYRVLEKYQYAKDCMEKEGEWINNLEKSRSFYEQYGKNMIRDMFPEYEERIAVGIVGEGSDCFGFDDKISMDHDYGVGFCMWLTDCDYKKIGVQLQQEYDRIIRQCGIAVDNDLFFKKRRGVFSINEFYNGLLNTETDYEKEWEPDYINTEEYRFAMATNGSVFRDDLGVFCRVRNKINEYYPEEVWRYRLAGALHEFSQYAQSNYARMMSRRDYITAGLCISKGIESAMDIAYLLNKTYAPYYKWKQKGMEKLLKLRDIVCILEEITDAPNQKEAWEGVSYSSGSINRKDKCICLFENIADVILNELKEQGLVQGEDLFLESYVNCILRGKNMDIIDKIVELEWRQFDKVKNEGGRADCQDDFGTFSIMRKSQYMTWSEELLNSYCCDLVEAENKGWNLIMEKYARMMKSTVPDRYAELEKDLPVLSDERIAIQEEIVRIQVAWMEEFAEAFPKMAGNARSIHTYEDNEYNTSYETYLRGELSTYSESTFVLYGRFIAELLQNNKNLAFETMSNTAKLYGYKSLEDAEKKI